MLLIVSCKCHHWINHCTETFLTRKERKSSVAHCIVEITFHPRRESLHVQNGLFCFPHLLVILTWPVRCARWSGQSSATKTLIQTEPYLHRKQSSDFIIILPRPGRAWSEQPIYLLCPLIGNSTACWSWRGDCAGICRRPRGAEGGKRDCIPAGNLSRGWQGRKICTRQDRPPQQERRHEPQR